MKAINYVQDTEKFWRAHKESREAVDRDIARRSPAEQRVIMTKIRANNMAMRNAKRIA